MNGTEDPGRESADIAEWASGAIPSTGEQLDEDELAADSLEEAMDPPDDWSAADRYATPPGNSEPGIRWSGGSRRRSPISCRSGSDRRLDRTSGGVSIGPEPTSRSRCGASAGDRSVVGPVGLGEIGDPGRLRVAAQ